MRVLEYYHNKMTEGTPVKRCPSNLQCHYKNPCLGESILAVLFMAFMTIGTGGLFLIVGLVMLLVDEYHRDRIHCRICRKKLTNA